MNRVIKFRVFDTELKIWINNLGMKSNNVLLKGTENRFHVMQFTGLKDKAGNEIYEGDLVKHDAWDYPFEIIFHQEKARFVCKMKAGLTQYIHHEALTVVGNIYESNKVFGADNIQPTPTVRAHEKDNESLLQQIRQAFADYYASEGCDCCENTEPHKEALLRLGKLLGAERYNDNSGFNWLKYQSEQ